MCLMAFAIQAAPGLPLLLAANRDEALDRPTLPLHRWPRSRGELPLRWLDGTPLDTLTQQLDPTAYSAFNLVVGDLAIGHLAG